jgi:hypothetical protein
VSAGSSDLAAVPSWDDALATCVAGYGDLPYPGRRPPHGFVQVDGRVLALRRRPDRVWALADGDVGLDGWLTGRGAAALAGRVPLLCYGSNACPSKLQDLRDRAGLTGPVVLTPCAVSGLAAAWCAGERVVDRAVPATLVPADGTEHHFLMAVAPEQWPALDHCEGRGTRYDLVTVGEGCVRDDLGRPVPDARAYVGIAPTRQPMADAAGRPLLVRHLDQRGARAALRARAGRR